MSGDGETRRTDRDQMSGTISGAVAGLHAELVEAYEGGASSNDMVQIVDDWFVAQGWPSVIFGSER